jgi:hypothetical protein
MVIELKKDSSIFLTGMTPDKAGDLKKAIINDKRGLGVLFKMVDGHLEEADRVQTELKLRTESSNAAVISFKINDSAYHYLVSYIDSFKLKGYDRLYNGLNRPREGGGSGCTAFGISFLELINALLPEYTSRWAVHINIPEKLIGSSADKRRVSIGSIFFAFRWARNKRPYRKLTLYEPYLIYEWINTAWNDEQQNAGGKYQLRQFGLAKGIEIDCRACMPQQPMFVK